MRKAKARSVSGRSRADRIFFEHSASSIWEEDIAGLLSLIAGWKARGIRDLRAYLSSHLGILRKAIRSITVVDVNAATLHLYGATDKKQLLGPLGETIDSETLPSRIELILAIAECRREVQYESMARTLGGNRIDVLVQARIPTPGDPYPYMLVTVTDITERKRLEERINQERGLLLSLINNSPDPFFYKDKEGRFLLVNRAFADLTGLAEPDDALGKNDFDLVPPEIAEKYRADDRAVMDSGVPSSDIEEEHVRNDGTRRWLLTRKVPIMDAMDQVIGLLGTSRDVTSRKQAEIALAKERAILNALMDTIPDHIYFKDLQSRFILNNRADALDMGEPDPKNLLGKTDFDYFAKEHAQKAYDDERRIISTGVPLVNELEEETWPDRPSKWVSTTKMPLRNDSGEIVGTLGISRDVTEQRRMIEALEEAQKYAESLIQTANIIVVGMDPELRINAFNEMAEIITGYKRAELEGRFMFEVLTPPDRYPEVWTRMRGLMRTGLPRVFESPILTRSGEERHIIWHISEVRKHGAPAGSIGFGLDVTERRRVEEQSLLLATLVESSHDAIIGTDGNAIVISWNRGAEIVYGYKAADMIGKSANAIIPPERLEEARAYRERVLRGEDVARFETQRIHRDGRLIFVSLTLFPIRNAQRAITGIGSVSSDVTAQKALQAQLIRAQRLESLATLAMGIAHQFNNINTVIRGYLDILAADGSLASAAHGYVEGALRSLERSISITERLQGLTSSSPSALEDIDLAAVIQSLLPLYEKRFEEEKAGVTTDFTERALARANRSLLGFVLGSLLTNALHALLDRPSRAIRIRTRAAAGLAGLEVSDTGCGIRPEDQPRIFTPFFTTKGEWAEPGSSQARLKGVGLSLAVSQSTIAELGGWIEVESVAQEGSTFRVWLPAAAAPQL
ncbi:MAG TPA: PAS domain S-box protein [Spirochaetia bacterium]|nr:PAS domain S-box protein [Spirochaetia bacterium]